MKTQTKHTSGPWRAVLDNDSADPISIFQDDGTGNGDHIRAIAGDPESEANMRLIAAAPDLLAALRVANIEVELAARVQESLAEKAKLNRSWQTVDGHRHSAANIWEKLRIIRNALSLT